jgi:hypothetical protein
MSEPLPSTAPTAPAQFNAREQAALTLRIPASGTQWLDAMIAHALQRESIEAVYRAYVTQKIDATSLGVIQKNGLEAWMSANSSDFEAARKAAEAMIKPQKPKAPEAAAAARAPGPTLSLAQLG